MYEQIKKTIEEYEAFFKFAVAFGNKEMQEGILEDIRKLRIELGYYDTDYSTAEGVRV